MVFESMIVVNDPGKHEHPRNLFQVDQPALQQRFEAALSPLIEQLKQDAAIIAAIQCSSLAPETLWAKSDLDLVLVTIDDCELDVIERSLVTDNINIHTHLLPRKTFQQVILGEHHNTEFHTLLTQSTLLYTHDATLANSYRAFELTCHRDNRIPLLRAGIALLPAWYKAHEWFHVHEDLDYTLLWVLSAATPLAQIEAYRHQLLPERDVIAQAMALNPAVFQLAYTDVFRMMGRPKSTILIQTAPRNNGYLSCRAHTDVVSAYFGLSGISWGTAICQHD